MTRNLCVLCMVLCLGAVSAASVPAMDEPSGKEAPGVEERWGIQIVAVRVTESGYMLDFRYRVRNPEKAAPLFDKKVETYLVDQASGARMPVPVSQKLGALRAGGRGGVERGRVYFIIFANPGKIVKAGSKVTVVIGDFMAPNLTVE